MIFACCLSDAAEYTSFTFKLAGKVKLVDEETKVEVDNADSGTNTEGCIMKYNSTCKCIEFIFGI